MNIDRFATFESSDPDSFSREQLEHIVEEKISEVDQMSQDIGLEMLSTKTRIFSTAIILDFLFVKDVKLVADTTYHSDFIDWGYILECKGKSQHFSDDFKFSDVLTLALQFSKGEHLIDNVIGAWKKIGHNSFIKVADPFSSF